MDRIELKNKIPYGYGKIIAKKAGVTERSVSKYMTGKTNSSKIEMAALEVLAELYEHKKILVEKIEWSAGYGHKHEVSKRHYNNLVAEKH